MSKSARQDRIARKQASRAALPADRPRAPVPLRRRPPEARPGKPATRILVLVALGLVALTLAGFSGVRHNDFTNYDDTGYVTQNASVQQGLTAESVRWAFTSRELGNWHPLTWLSHMAVFRLAGLDPAAHHLANLCLHLVSTILLFLVLASTTHRPLRSGIVAALFAVHPLHVESVAWVAERKDVLSTVFWMATLLAYAAWVRRPGTVRYMAMVVVFALGLMSKPMLVTLPLVLLLLDFWPLSRTGLHPGDPPSSARLGALVIEKLPLFALSALAGVVALSAQQLAGTVQTLEAAGPLTRVANALLAYAAYIRKTFWPLDLAVFYPYPDGFQPLGVIVALALLVGVSLIAVRWAGRFPYLPVGWFWFVITLLPVIGLFQVGQQAYADRYTYVPLIGLFVLLTWAASDAIPAGRQRLAALAFLSVAVLATSVWLTRAQVGYWRDSVTLFSRCLDVTPANFVAHHKLGESLAEAGRPEDAVIEFTRALELKPRFAQAHSRLGVLLAEGGRMDEAVWHLEQALEIVPEAGTHNNLGVALARSGRMREAAEQFEAALRLEPRNPDAQRHLARVRSLTGEAP